MNLRGRTRKSKGENTMYSNLPNLVLAFHSCDEETCKKVLYQHEALIASQNSYDWLGNGVYFWENSLARAKEWAETYCERHNREHPDKEKKKPAVIGAVISLGYYLDLTNYGSSEILKNGYEILSYELSPIGKEMPVYSNSGIMEKTHVQLCIINPNCIKRYFKSLVPDSKWCMV